MPVALDGLNRAQEAAVTHPDGPLVVVAGADQWWVAQLGEQLTQLVVFGRRAGVSQIAGQHDDVRR